MEVTQVGVVTKARAMAIVREEAADDNLGAVKRRKIGNGKLTTYLQTKSLDRQNNYVNSEDSNDSENFSASFRSINGVPVSCCSSTGPTGSMEKPKVSDLEEESGEIETVARYKLDGSESIPSTECKAESGELDSATVKQSAVMANSCRTVLPVEKMPPAAELEEFFAAAQKDLHKRFRDKYNYDIVNDIPLKGRFEWIEIKPQK